MAILSPTSDDDLLADQIRKRQMLQAMPGINGQQDPNVQIDPTTQQPIDPTSGAPIAPPPQQPIAPPPPAPQAPVAMAPPPPSPYQQQIADLNKNVSQIGQAGQDLSALKATAPQTGQYKISKLRAGLLMPLEILAAAGGRDTSKEYGSIIRPGYNKAMSAYQAKLDAAQSKFDTLRETTKAQLDALKEEGVITNQEAEAAYRKAETEFKVGELKVRQQEADTAKLNIPALNQGLALGEAEAKKNGTPWTQKEFNKTVEDYWTAVEKSRTDAEIAKAKAEKIARDEEKRTARQESNIAQNITKEQGRLNDVIKPLENARQAMTNLKTLRAEGNDDGFARLLSVIMADNALSSASHGSVRQNIGIINELIKSPGWLEWLKGKAQGLLVPGKGSISEATMQQIDRILDATDKQLETEEKAARKNLIDLNAVDPTDPGARDAISNIIDRQYDIPQPTRLPKPPEVPQGDWQRTPKPPNKPPDPNKTKRLQGMSDKELDDAIKAAGGH